ncbi:MAG: riboflavin biosynthesis protein RibF [Lentisphaeria bacterium]|nr:riboflavin biosynthesis protein RibF [Lentisphaeria bacterium]
MTEKSIIQTDSIDALKAYGIDRISVAIGVFDGVHAGHRKLLTELQMIAAATDSIPVAVTFSPHPRQILSPENAPALLLPPDEKCRRLTESGVRAVVTIPFTREFAGRQPTEFISGTLECDGITLCGLCVGKKWRFGAGGSGDTRLLGEIAKECGFRFVPVDEVHDGPETVSSSSIRAAAAAGDLTKAARYLCRPYMLFGPVVHGEGVAGKKLDAPTANIKVEYGVLPPPGVYAAWLVLSDGTDRHPAVVNIGSSPTFDSYGRKDLMRVEAHLLDGGRDLYGEYAGLELVSYLRAEQRFATIDGLKRQILMDIEATWNILKRKEEK